MARRTSIYRRLTGRSRTLVGYSQLWMGPDHILLVKSTRLSEDYQRFAFSDIQSIAVTQRGDRTVFQVIAGLTMLAWTLAALAVSSIFGKWFFAVTGLLGCAWVIMDIVGGPRCRCYLRTAVSRELLAPVCRMRYAESLLAEIQTAIEAVQGSLPAGGLSRL